MKKATLIAKIPTKRFRSIDDRVPEVGDTIVLDQGFTFPNGQPGCLVYGLDRAGQYRFEAEVYESKIGDDLET